MKPRPVQIYVCTMALLALAALWMSDWAGFWQLSRSSLIGFAVFLVLGLLSEVSAFSYRVGRNSGTSSLIFVPLLACVLLFGPAAALMFVTVTVAVVEFLIRRKEPLRGIFNVSQYIVAAWVAGQVFLGLSGYPIATVEGTGSFDAQEIPVLAFGITLLVLNHFAVGTAISFASGQSLPKVLRSILQSSAGSVVLDLLALPVAILVAFLYFELGIRGLALALLPLAFIRYAYSSKHQLEQANSDLLAALVKAIETRDPYTSGHSVRVQGLASKIGRAIGIPGRKVAGLERAALLHDIGKIEVVYEEILTKDGPLTSSERTMIESHVTRGVEILTSLSSFRSEIIEAVRHHHEAFDGSGYPDGLAGDDIPLFARIIQVADSIDAMLSDRPYRPALSVSQVEEQLRKNRDRQFDGELADRVLELGLVAEHAEDIQVEKSVRDGEGANRVQTVFQTSSLQQAEGPRQ